MKTHTSITLDVDVALTIQGKGITNLSGFINDLLRSHLNLMDAQEEVAPSQDLNMLNIDLAKQLGRLDELKKQKKKLEEEKKKEYASQRKKEEDEQRQWKMHPATPQ